MIYKLLRYTMTLLLALMVSGMLTSCIFDDFVDADFSEAEGKTLYLSINVKSDSDIALTRADNEPKVPDANGMLDGDWPEHLTTDHIAIFFNENEAKEPGSLYAITTLGLPATHEDFNDDKPNQKEANYIAVFRVTEEDKKRIENKEIDLPKYCLVILNSSNEIKKQLEKYKNDPKADYNTIVKEIWESNDEPEEIGFNGKRFTMTNSVYVKDGKVHAAQKFSLDKFFDTPDEAKKQPAVTIYVERMVAKFTFGINSNNPMTRSATDDGNDDSNIMWPQNSDKEAAAPLVFFDKINNDNAMPDETNTLYKALPWRVNITGWGINAQEKDSYIFKNIKADGDYFGNSIDDWNAEGYFRSYWSEDPHYDKDEKGITWTYPLQYRKALDNKELDNYTQNEEDAGDKEKKNKLKNYCYNDFIKNGIGKEIYAPENTYDPDLYKKGQNAYLDDRTGVLAGTHLLVCAEVQIKKGDDEKYEAPKDLYRDRQGIYYESKEQFFRMFVHSINSLLKSQRTMDFVLYDWEKGGHIEVDYTEKILDDDGEEIEVPNETHELTAKPKNLSETQEYQLYYYDPNNEELKKLGLMDEDGYMEMTGATIDGLIKEDQFDKIINLSSAMIENGDGKILPWFDNDKLVICTTKDHTKLDIYTRDEVVPFYKRDKDGKLIIDEKTGKPIQLGYESKDGTDVTESVLNDYDNCIKSLLYEWFGPIDHFDHGRMYYATPISHKGGSMKQYDAEKEEMGDYGVVRNCWYDFTLTGINRIGTPVDNPDEPIVPGLVDIKDVINTKVEFEIIRWHEENTTAPLY